MHIISTILGKIEHSILVISFSIMSILAFVNVISRYFLNSSFSFTEEITINLFVLLVMMGTSVGIREKSHLGFNLLFESMAPNIRIIFSVVLGIISTAIFVTVTYFGYDMIQFQMMLNQTTASLGWPQWVFSLALPVGSLFCLFRVIEATIAEAKEILNERRQQV
ncbi:TRAP transporter small permease [Bacillus sp. Marseille-P3661]|uniref:TRAP transporter small permease n=1 Tax=Bacillus sp. Marseille-P3661 TaxID=1936234 RepID=UPI0021555585|nr:TRAP transporter small permease [Bacillus sp. Marseille-P3661]